MDTIDNLVVSFLDLEANKILFKRELASLLNLLPSDITYVELESEFDGVVHQRLRVSVKEQLTLDDLKKIPFSFIDTNGDIIFEVGDVVL